MGVDDRNIGLFDKYHISKTDGSPVDPKARYLVLRLDSGWAVTAARRAALTFASWLRDQNPVLADDIAVLVESLDGEDTPDPAPRV